MTNNLNTQLPVEVTEEIIYQAEEKAEAFFKNLQAEFPEGDFSNQIAQQIGFRKGHRASATEYATKMHQLDEHFKVMSISCDAQLEKIQQLQQENASLKDWKHSALAILNPLWDYADKHLNVPLGEIKTEAMIKRIKELEHQNDKLKERATGWRPLLEEVLREDALRGTISTQTIEKIKKYLYGE